MAKGFIVTDLFLFLKNTVGLSLIVLSFSTAAMMVEDGNDAAIDNNDVTINSNCLHFIHHAIGKILDGCDQAEDRLLVSGNLSRLPEILSSGLENEEALSPAEIFKYVTFFVSVVSGLGVILPASLCTVYCPQEYASSAMSAMFIGLAVTVPCYIGHFAVDVYEKCRTQTPTTEPAP